MSVKAHYENHLARIYSWMLGDFSDKVAEQKNFFSSQNIRSELNDIALDLGSGNGIQAVALASLGFRVTAVDFNALLLDELIHYANSLSVWAVESEILTFLQTTSVRPSLITCMGDTLTHLPDHRAVEEMITNAARVLIESGTMVLSYRDLSRELKSNERFIHVKSDDTRTMTCFLEFFPEYVMVHDIITERENNSWHQTVSHYPKLRLPETWVVELMARNGLHLTSRTIFRGMLYLVGRKSIRKPPSV